MSSSARTAPRRLLLGAALALVVAGAPGAWAAPVPGRRAGKPLHLPPGRVSVKKAPKTGGNVQVLVELAGPPAALVWAAALADRSVPPGQALNNAKVLTAAAVQRNKLAQVKAAAALAGLNAREIYRVQRALNGIAVSVNSKQLASIRKLPGVKAVRPIVQEFPSNITSVPFINAPRLWGGEVAGVGRLLTGDGVRIGIIDTGIDYQHPNFGGSGLLADYQNNDRVTVQPGQFPTAKVVGGTDFAGDSYDGFSSPSPDPNPMDCNGHGSHVAGTAAGFGVTTAGATYTGIYTSTTPFSSLRIGPGVAPRALLYALRVFGCGGGTTLTPQAIDWAIDPNGDSDFSDHLDVVNMSLASSYGGPSDLTAQASDNAAQVGVIVVAAAGNDGDVYFISGSPATSGRTISVAAGVDPGVLVFQLHVNAPPAIAGDYTEAPSFFTPAAPVQSGQTADVVYAAPNDACSALTNAAAVNGKIALVDRGTCSFVTKVQNVQAAGAIAAVVANDQPGLITMVGSGATTIPSVMISQADGATIKADLPGVNVTLPVPPSAADTLAFFSSRGPREIGSPIRLKPDIAAPGESVESTLTGMSCDQGGTPAPGCILPTTDGSGIFPGGQRLILSGTSMATAHVSGTLALLRQLHPDWSVEELKAQAMNGALHSLTTQPNGAGLRYGVGRTGAGRVDDAISAPAQVTAFNGDDAGLVSVSFDNREVLGTLTDQKTVRLVNHGAADASYDLAFDVTNAAPGVNFSLPSGASVTVPAGQSLTFPVQINANAATMDHAIDPTISATQALGFDRFWLTEAGGYLTFSQGSQLKMRLPLYAPARAVSAMAGTGPIGLSDTSIALSGTGVCTGTLSGPNCSGSFPTNEVSLVTPFELQFINQKNGFLAPNFQFNIQHVGVATDGTNLFFGLSAWGPWSSPNDVVWNVVIADPTDPTFSNARTVFNSNLGFLTGAGNDDTFGSFVADDEGNVSANFFALNVIDPQFLDTRAFDNNVMFLTAKISDLGLSGTSFIYFVQTCPNFDPLCGPFSLDVAPPGVAVLNWDSANPGLDWGGGILFADLNGAAIGGMTVNTVNLTTNNSLGALLLHHHNAAGTTAQVVAVGKQPTADLAVTKSAAPPSPSVGQNVVFTIAVTNNGPNDATCVVVNDVLDPRLTYVSDDSLGAYNIASGDWTVGVLANGASATLHITATVTTSDPIPNLAQVSACSPLDPVPGNNQSQVIVSAPRSADLALANVASAAAVQGGLPVTFTLTVRNLGADPAFNVKMSETFPAFPTMQASSFTASAGVFNPATGLWSLASLAAGASETLSITVTAPLIAGPLKNTGVVTAATSDPVNSNNTASATANVQIALAQIPTLDPVGLALLFAGLAGGALVALRRRRRGAA
ncbi:MAG TPA: S8 family serine peptidase [Thermoanaerobaculia bacterium]|nr:S8 family serine peptidase [Thermoanaerobaculia bacterium]